MQNSPLTAVLVASRGLNRHLFAELLRNRCGARVVATFATIAELQSAAIPAEIVLLELNGAHTDASDAVIARLRSTLARSRVIAVYGDDDTLRIDDIVGEVLSGTRARPSRPAARANTQSEPLTPLETEVLLAVASGLRNAEIARRMRRSSKTVEKHRANVQRKLGLRNVAQLTAYAIRDGLLDADIILARRDA